MFTYADLKSYWRKSLRNGNWRKLSLLDKAFFRAALWYAKVNDKIVNLTILDKLGEILNQLKDTIGRRILKRGLGRAHEMLFAFEEKGVFNWAPKLKIWLKDSRYIFWLGLFQRDG